MSCPAAFAYIPDWPHPVIRPNTNSRVALQARVGPDAEALHHARPEALDEGIGRRHQIQQRGGPVGMLEIDGDVAPAAQQQVVMRCIAGTTTDRLGALDADHLGAHVGQHHRRKGARADACKLDDAIAGERS